MKVIINNCYGGFSLSDSAILRYAELKGWTLYPEYGEHAGLLGPTYWRVPPEARMQESDEGFYALSLEDRQLYNQMYSEQTFHDRDLPRDDAVLVQVVDELGAAAGGRHADLKIVGIPDDVEWEIEEYDGTEWVAEKHRVWS